MRMISGPLSLLLACGVQAVCVAVADAPTASRIEAVLPGVKVRSVSTVLGLPGLYEVVDGDGRFIYVDAELTHGIVGELFDLSSRRNLSMDSLAQLNVVDFDTLPLELAIRRVKGNGSRRMAVFADPDCPFCTRLEQSLASVDDVTVFTFLYPVAELHPEAHARASAIWCATDQDAAWLAWLLKHRAPPAAAADCAAPLADVASIVTRYNVQGTPSLVFGSGRVLSGALPSEAINEYLNEPRLAVPGTAANQAAAVASGR